MKIYSEVSLSGFKFWSGAKCRAEMLTSDELDMFGEMLEDIYPEGVDEMTVNDIMWFDFEWVCESLGLEYDCETGDIIR